MVRAVIFLTIAIGIYIVFSKPPIPDVRSISAEPYSPYIKNKRGGKILINSKTLEPGVYKIMYRSFYNNDTGHFAKLVMHDNYGIFETYVPSNEYESLLLPLTIETITNSQGYTAATDLTIRVWDSSGLLTAEIPSSLLPHYKSITFPECFIDTQVGELNIQSAAYDPFSDSLSSIDLNIVNSYKGPGVYPISLCTPVVSAGYYTRCSKHGSADMEAVYGSISILSTQPLLTGSFSFTCNDSTKISGSFTCNPVRR